MTKKKTPKALIRAHELIAALEMHVLGAREMKPTQVSAALALLKKILPDAAGRGKAAKEGRKTRRAHEDALRELE